MELEDPKHPTLHDAEEACFKTFISKYAINKWKKLPTAILLADLFVLFSAIQK